MTLLAAGKGKTLRFNWTMLVMIGALISVGLINLYSSLHSWGGSEGVSLFWSQIIWVSLGFIVMIFLSFFDYRLFEKAAPYIYSCSILLLVLVLFFGKTVAGHKSWLAIGGLAIQPSEFAKIALIIILSKDFGNSLRPDGVSLLELWRPILYSLVPTLLVVAQGDLGSAIFFVLIFATYAWFGSLRGRWIVILIITALIGSVLLYAFGLSGYQRSRIKSFIDPSADSRGSGYHLVQSRIAVGSGRLFGRGYRQGNVNKLKYLPEKHTDFIFPVLAEEWGFIGSTVALGLYLMLFLSGVEIVKRARDRIGLFMALGIIAFIFWHVVINLGGVLGLMPLTGVPLPFFSYGGSSTIITMGSLGILLSIGTRRFLF